MRPPHHGEAVSSHRLAAAAPSHPSRSDAALPTTAAAVTSLGRIQRRLRRQRFPMVDPMAMAASAASCPWIRSTRALSTSRWIRRKRRSRDRQHRRLPTADLTVMEPPRIQRRRRRLPAGGSNGDDSVGGFSAMFFSYSSGSFSLSLDCQIGFCIYIFYFCFICACGNADDLY